VQVTKINLSKN